MKFYINCLILISYFFVYSQSKDNKKCKVLVLEGGGDKGAYQAGVINGLATYLPKDDIKWDVITGVSIGSINAGFLGMFSVGNETAASFELMNHWRHITGSNVYENWPYLGPVYGLLYKSGLFDTEVGKAFINNTLLRYGGKIKREIYVSATNVRTGSYDTFTNNDFKSVDDITEALLSSAAFPVMFPLRKFKNETYMDGGVKFNLDISSGVNACERKGFDQKDILVDIILCGNSSLPLENPDNLSPLGSFIRYYEISSFSKSMDIIEDMSRYMSNVTIRYLVAPSKPLPSAIIPLSFDPADIEKMINYGIEDAKNIVSLGPNKHAKKTLNLITEKKKKFFSSQYIPKNIVQDNQIDYKKNLK